MSEIIAGVAVPDTAATADATRFVGETTSPLLFHHSRRVFIFSSLHSRRLGLEADPELLYVAALFHDTGLLTPFSSVEQRFEIDGADHAKAFLLERGFDPRSIEVVWNAIALHTTPAIPVRMGSEIAAINLGVLTDVIGFGLDELDTGTIDEITAAHPRGDFKNDFLHGYYDGIKHRPETTYGTVNADILEHFSPDYRSTTMVERVIGSAWPS
ncbi:MAG: cyanamide hydratase [Microbacteriaceae bacterium]|nr:cyanamide hydratase [Microbacteriaceae bacterium]